MSELWNSRGDIYKGKKRNGVLILVAAEDEMSTLTDIQLEFLKNNYGIRFKIIGVGKVNAAVNTSHLLHEYRPKWVLNIGTAGHTDGKSTGLFRITSVEERDMDATKIMRSLKSPTGSHFLFPDYPKKLTPYESEIELPCDIFLPPNEKFSAAICSTGDNTHAEIEDTHAKDAIVEMEAYGIVKAIKRFKVHVRFDIIKWITDFTDKKKGEDWDKNKGTIPWAFLLNEVMKQIIRWENES